MAMARFILLCCNLLLCLGVGNVNFNVNVGQPEMPELKTPSWFSSLFGNTEPSSSFYDLIVDMTELSELSADANGWKVEVSEKFNLTEGELNGYHENGEYIALMGLYSKGKTWVLNALLGEAFESGEEIATKGLSLKVMERNKDRYYFLDTAGTGAPATVRMSQGDDVIGQRKLLFDRKSMEALQHEVLFDLARSIVIVVDRITHNDQQLILGFFDQLAELQVQRPGSEKKLLSGSQLSEPCN
eukprot:TRINITY_DN9308_c0_g2_i1.p1 TRINITY_DN9308_c0_g2~~TRINITY_DN9308_c0_g2_i1.p1  ORF type:complete len:243 (-),score=83.79 TRINITY_DN9308_c0_g2_i1:712-1440(-)